MRDIFESGCAFFVFGIQATEDGSVVVGLVNILMSVTVFAVGIPVAMVMGGPGLISRCWRNQIWTWRWKRRHKENIPDVFFKKKEEDVANRIYQKIDAMLIAMQNPRVSALKDPHNEAGYIVFVEEEGPLGGNVIAEVTIKFSRNEKIQRDILVFFCEGFEDSPNPKFFGRHEVDLLLQEVCPLVHDYCVRKCI